MNELIWWILGFGTGYCVHALVAMRVCPAYREYFHGLTGTPAEDEKHG